MSYCRASSDLIEEDNFNYLESIKIYREIEEWKKRQAKIETIRVQTYRYDHAKNQQNVSKNI